MTNKLEKLSIVPLSVLLPNVGSLDTVSERAPVLQEMFSQIHSENVASTAVVPREKLNEESMLSQVMQWLSIGS